MLLFLNTAGQTVPFGLKNTAASGSGLAGASVNAYVSIDGGAQAAGGGSITDLGNGQYVYFPTQAETNGVILSFWFTAPVQTTEAVEVIAWTTQGGTDPLVNAVPGAYAAGSAGFILGTALDATVSSRAAPGAAMALTSGERNSVATALLDLANGVDVGVTLRHALMAMAAVLAGKLNTAGLVALFRNFADTKNRVQVTMSPGGNRTSVTFDFS